MIRKLFLENFQCHENTEVIFSPGVTAFIGASDVGKSALFRAIKWFLTGRPVGGQVVTYGKKKCKVGFLFDDGTTIFRCWENGKNFYLVNGERRDNFGNTLPEEVMSLVNISEEINLIGQFDWFRLFYMSPADLAKYFNSIIDFNGIYSSLDYVGRKKNEVEAKLQNLSKRVVSLEEKLVSFEGLDEAGRLIEELKHIQDSYCALEEEKEELKRCIERGESFPEFKSDMERAKKYINAIFELESKIVAIENRRTPFLKPILKLVELKPYIEILNDLRAGKEDFTMWLEDLKNCEEHRELAEGLALRIKILQEEIKFKAEEIVEIRKRLDEIGLCPLCGRPLKGKAE